MGRTLQRPWGWVRPGGGEKGRRERDGCGEYEGNVRREEKGWKVRVWVKG